MSYGQQVISYSAYWLDSESTNPIPVIYQSGYLTIKGYDERFGIYRLGFPNREVEVGDYDSFFRCLQSFFADTPYKMVRELELHCQNILFIVFKLVGFYVKVEYHTARGVWI